MAEWFKALVLKTGVEQSTEGSNPSLSVFLPKPLFFGVARSVGYLRAAARVPTVFLPPLTPRINGFSFEKPLSSNKVPLPCASGVFCFYGNMRCGINGFMPQGFEARNVV